MSNIFHYTLIRSKRRTVAIQINKNAELIVRAPMRTPKEFIENFLHEKRGWIAKHQEKMRQVPEVEKKIFSEKEIHEMKKNLAEYILPRVHELWKRTGFPPYTNIKITKSEHRWASCSGRNSLNFSYRLAHFLDGKTNFIDAVIIHELCHIVEKNHQKNFWRLVYKYCPDYENYIQLSQENTVNQKKCT